jgi:hypothetical protein
MPSFLAYSTFLTKYNSHGHGIILRNICVTDRDKLLNLVYPEIFFKASLCCTKFLFLFCFLHRAPSDWLDIGVLCYTKMLLAKWLTRESALFFLSQFTLSPSLFYEPHQLYFPFISESYSTTGHFVARRITLKHTSDRVDVLNSAMISAPASTMHFAHLYTVLHVHRE